MIAMRILTGLAALAALVMGSWGGIQRWRSSQAQSSTAALTAEVTTLRSTIDSLLLEKDAPASALAEVAAPILVPNHPAVAEALRDLELAGKTSSAEITQLKPTTKVGTRQSFRITGAGSVHQVCVLLASIERTQRVFLVDRVRIRSGEAERLAFEVLVSSFYEKESP